MRLCLNPDFFPINRRILRPPSWRIAAAVWCHPWRDGRCPEGSNLAADGGGGPAGLEWGRGFISFRILCNDPVIWVIRVQARQITGCARPFGPVVTTAGSLSLSLATETTDQLPNWPQLLGGFLTRSRSFLLNWLFNKCPH